MSRLGFVSTAVALAFLATPALAGSGTFKGASGHTTKGSVTVTEAGGTLTVKLGSNFFLDGAPDPYVALGNGASPIKGGLIALLKNTKGGQSYSIKATGALSKATHVVIWCKKYSVPLGVAKVK